MQYLTRLVPILLLAQVVALVVHWRRRRRRGERASRAFAFFTALSFLVTWPPCAWLAFGSLEWRYTTDPRPDGDAEAIVVLAGAVFFQRPYRPVAFLAPDTYRRVRHAAWLYRHWRELPVLCSGGVLESAHPDSTLAAAMVEYLEQEGVAREHLLVEERSANTYENALYTAELLRERGIERIALVTDAFHMLRAEKCFRAQGIEVVPAPTGHRAAELEGGLASIVPSFYALQAQEKVFHEWMGILWYTLRGRI